MARMVTASRGTTSQSSERVRRVRPSAAWLVAALALAALAGFAIFRIAGSGSAADWSAAAERVGQQAVAQALPAGEQEPEWRDLAVYQYNMALKDERGVCGRVFAGPRTGGSWTDFAVRVRLERAASGSRAAVTSTEVFLAEGPGGMRTLYLARQRFCRDGTAAPAAPVQPAPARDPLPAPRPAAPLTAQAPAPPAPAMPTGTSGAPAVAPAEGGGSLRPAAAPPAPVLGRIAVRSPVNLRTGPGGGASVIGVLPRGKTLDVLERAPGGWMRVGDPASLGWVHASLVQVME
jgi:hypothetical protein